MPSPAIPVRCRASPRPRPAPRPTRSPLPGTRTRATPAIGNRPETCGGPSPAATRPCHTSRPANCSEPSSATPKPCARTATGSRHRCANGSKTGNTSNGCQTHRHTPNGAASPANGSTSTPSAKYPQARGRTASNKRSGQPAKSRRPWPQGSSRKSTKGAGMSDQPTSETLRLVEGRESNRCIVCDRYLRAGNWPGMSHHHRKRRSQTYGDPERHAPSNVIDVCGTDNSTGCHGWIHQHPEQARALGYLLKSYDPEPSQVPVYSCRRGWILLDTNGQWHSCPPPEDLPPTSTSRKATNERHHDNPRHRPPDHPPRPAPPAKKTRHAPLGRHRNHRRRPLPVRTPGSRHASHRHDRQTPPTTAST